MARIGGADGFRTFGAVIIAHLDLDAFFAAVEELEDPAPRRVPLVEGGGPEGTR